MEPADGRTRPGLVDEPSWPTLATALTRASDAGYDVAEQLPVLVGRRPLPQGSAAQSLYYRLGDDCPDDAFAPIRSSYRYAPPPETPPRPAPLPDYARALGNPAASRRGPSR